MSRRSSRTRDLDCRLDVVRPTRHDVAAMRRVAAIAYEGEYLLMAADQAQRALRGDGHLVISDRTRSYFLAMADQAEIYDGIRPEDADRLVALMEGGTPIERAALLPDVVSDDPEQITVAPGSLVIVGGIPGSGKSTFARRQVAQGLDAVILDVDEHVKDGERTWCGFQESYNTCAAIAQEQLVKGRTVLWESTLTIAPRRWQVLALAARHRCATELILLPADAATSIQQIAARVKSGGHDVPAEVIRDYAQRWPGEARAVRYEGFTRIWRLSAKAQADCSITSA